MGLLAKLFRPDGKNEIPDNFLDVLIAALDMGYVIKSLGGDVHFVLPGGFDGRECVVTLEEIRNERNYHLMRDMLVTTRVRPKGEKINGYITLSGAWRG